MSNRIQVTLSEHPEVRALIRAADPGYKRKSATVVVREELELHGTYWDDGSRSTYTAVNMADHRSMGAPQYAPPQFGGPREVPRVTIPVGVCIVETGYFCGKVSTAYVYVRAENMARLLPASQVQS